MKPTIEHVTNLPVRPLDGIGSLTRNGEFELISAIAKRGLPILHELGATNHDLISANMDIEAVHEGHNLDLEKFLAFDTRDFNHDFIGIYVNLDRRTKVLRNCFSPRCTA